MDNNKGIKNWTPSLEKNDQEIQKKTASTNCRWGS